MIQSLPKVPSVTVEDVLGKAAVRTGLYRKELLAGRAYWGADAHWCRQLGFYLLQKHDLLSICFAHPKHPLGRCERFVLLITTLCFQWGFSVLIGEAFGPKDQRSEIQAADAFVAGLVVSVIMAFVGIIMMLAATSDDRICGSREGGLLKAVCSLSGRCVLAIMLLTAAGFAAMVFALAASAPVQNNGPGRYAIVLAFSLAQSWTYIFALSSGIGFALRWRGDKQKADAQDAKHRATLAKWQEEERAIAEEEAAAVAAEAAPAEARDDPELAAASATPPAAAAAAATSTESPLGILQDNGGSAASAAGEGGGRGGGFLARARRAAAAAAGQAQSAASAAARRAGAAARSGAEALRRSPVVSSATKAMAARRRRTVVTPPFSLSFHELQRWGEGADIDADAAAAVAATAAPTSVTTPQSVAVSPATSAV